MLYSTKTIQLYMRFAFIFLLSFPIYSQNILNQVKTGTPRQSVESFITAMNDYREGMVKNDKSKIKRIDDAIRTLNLEDVPIILRKEKGRETAILLKEVIDRVFTIDYSKIPDEEEILANPITKYYLNNSEIALHKVEAGERVGAFLFSKETIHLTPEFYDKVSHLPYLNPKTGGAYYQKPWTDKYISTWMKKYIIGVMIWQWIGLTIVILLGLTLRVIAKFILNKLFLLMKDKHTVWDLHIIENIKSPVALLLATAVWYFSLKLLRFHGDVLGFFHTLLKITLSIGLVWTLYGLMEVLSEYLKSVASKTESSLDDQLVPLLTKTLKIVVVIFGVLVAIQNIGINVMGVLAGLGLGGLAFALAAKDGIANFFGSLMILLDRPFQVGDSIVVNGSDGIVEEVGFRSTRIRTFYNSVVSIPNAEMMNAKIDNMGKRNYRRLSTKLGLTYDTPTEKVQEFVAGIRKLASEHPLVFKDNMQIFFNDFGSDSLVILVYIFFEVKTWPEELVNREGFLIDIKNLASRIGVEFAFPTQTLHIESIKNADLNFLNQKIQ
jgi:MscS family membrane protein